MAEKSQKAVGVAGGAKLQRTETVTIRLDPKMRYMAELASRLQRRSLSSYIEWAIDRSFKEVLFPGGEETLAEMAGTLWDVDEPDRFVTLAISHPDLLNHEEQRRWKLIRENGYLWRGHYAGPNGRKRWTWDTRDAADVLLERLREHWDDFVAVARGEAAPNALPTWTKEEPKTPTPTPAPTRGGVKSTQATSGDDFSDFPRVLEDDDDDLPF